MELFSEEKNKGKRIKTTKDNLSGLYDNSKCANIWIIQFPEEQKGKKMYENIFEQSIVVNFPNKEIANFLCYFCLCTIVHNSLCFQPRSTKSPTQGGPKEKHGKTDTNQIKHIETETKPKLNI